MMQFFSVILKKFRKAIWKSSISCTYLNLIKLMGRLIYKEVRTINLRFPEIHIQKSICRAREFALNICPHSHSLLSFSNKLN